LEQYGSAVKAWVATLSAAPLGSLTLEDPRARSAIIAIHEDRKRNFSKFGLPSTSAFSNFSLVTPRQAVPLERLSQKQKKQNAWFWQR
jgi:hypothetical protein